MKRVFSLILTLILLTVSVSTCAAEPCDSNYFNSYGASLSKLGGGKIKLTLYYTSVGTASQLGVSSFSVYEYTGSRWELVSGPNSGSYGYGVYSYSFNRTFSGVAGESIVW